MDGMGCQTAFAKTIVEKGGAYVFSLKGNQGTVYEDVVILFEDAKAVEYLGQSHLKGCKITV